MESKTFILEVLIGENAEVFMLRNGKGQVVLATQNCYNFLNYLRHADEIEAEKEQATEKLVKELEEEEKND